MDPAQAAKNGRWDEVKKFLETNSHCDDYELAIMVNRSPSTIRRWKRNAGIALQEFPESNKREQPNKPAVLPVIDDPDVWDCEEWFREYYEEKRYGLSKIAKIIKRSPRLVRLRLDKYGIEVRSHRDSVRSSNKCSTPEWLVYHYGTRDEYTKWAMDNNVEPDETGGKEWSLLKCSKEAKVSTATICNWLVRVNNDGCEINMRDLNESVAGHRNPFYGRKHPEELLEKFREYGRRGYAKTLSEISNRKAKGTSTS